VSLSQASESLSGEGDLGLAVLLPHLAAAVVERAEVRGDLVCIWVRARADGAACPRCGTWSAQVHDWYTRRLADAGIGGRRVLAWLRVRVLRCGSTGCPAGTFAEQIEGLTSRYARRTPLAARMLAAIASVLAGRPGSRLAAVLAVEAGRDTLIRVLMALPEPPAALIRVLGVDDFSLRRGRSYATVLVDLEAGVPVDVLPDREAATLEAWLRAHPGVEVICRDRAGAYDRAARAGAPDAIQVADRWHIWHNLGEHARTTVARHKDCLRGPAGDGPDPQDREKAGTPADLEAVIRGRHQAVHQLRAAGKSQAQAAAELGLSPQTAGRYWRAASPAALLAARSASALDPYKPYLRARRDQGATKIAPLFREITQLGYTGSYTTVYAWLGQLNLAAPARKPAPPKPGQVTGWILADPARLDPAGATALAGIRARCPQLDALARHITEFATILTGQHGSRLDTWIAAVDADDQPDLHRFTAGIRQDYHAVRNGLTLPWNSGPVEGLNTRTKLLERQMYGRASFPLLRKRILLTSRNTSP
jgi:transposase